MSGVQPVGQGDLTTAPESPIVPLGNKTSAGTLAGTAGARAGTRAFPFAVTLLRPVHRLNLHTQAQTVTPVTLRRIARFPSAAKGRGPLPNVRLPSPASPPPLG